MAELEKLKKMFILSSEAEKERLKEVLKRIVKYAKVTETGTVFFEVKGLPKNLMLALALAARFVAGMLDEKISQEVMLEELASMVGVDKKTASARLSELSREGLVISVGRGRYRMAGLYMVEKVLEMIAEKVEEK